MKRFAMALLGFAGILSLSAQAQMKPEDAIKLRQSAMKLIGYNFGSIGAMVNDKKPYNKDEAIRNANRIEGLSSQPFEFFIAGTDKGETKARPEIWKDNDKFRGLAEKMQVEAAKIALSDAPQSTMDLGRIAPGETLTLHRPDFDAAISGLVHTIEGTVSDLLRDAGITADEVDSVFFTGGTSGVPLLRERISALLPQARSVEGDRFGSIGAGLAIDAVRKFG